MGIKKNRNFVIGYMVTDGNAVNGGGLFYMSRAEMPRLSEMKERIIIQNNE